MFIDAAAIVAILSGEAEADRCGEALAQAEKPITTAIAAWEAIAALSRPDKFGDVDLAREAVGRLIERSGIQLSQLPEPDALLTLSVDAMARYGRGARRLNMADCIHYATARHFGVPILSTADEFRSTDLETVP